MATLNADQKCANCGEPGADEHFGILMCDDCFVDYCDICESIAIAECETDED